LVDVFLHRPAHEARGVLGALLPGEDAGGHDAVEADLVQGPEEDVPVDLALAVAFEPSGLMM
jgi:hypothetical protein